MKTTITKSILMALALIAIAPSANAQIASQEYVDDQKDAIISGTNSEWLAQAAGMAGLTTTELVENAEEAGVASTLGISYFLMNNVQQKLGDANNTGVVVATSTPGSVSYTGIDSAPTDNSDNLVTSGGVYDAIAGIDMPGKQDNLGGGNDAGKVVTATGTAGTVTYTEIDSRPVDGSTNLVTSDGVYDALTNAVSVYQHSGDGLVVTKYGRMQTATGGVITNTNISSSAAIEMGKVAFPTPPTACETAGCMLMYVNGQYTWEIVVRETNESPTVTPANAVSATPTPTTDPRQSVRPASCPATYSWDGTACSVPLEI